MSADTATVTESGLLGVLYDRSIVGVVVVSATLQAAALPVLYWLARRPAQ